MRNIALIATGTMLVLGIGQRAFALPSFGADCTSCHTGSRGTVTITGNDAAANPAEACGTQDRGTLNVFRVTQGATKTLSGTLSGLNAGAHYAALVAEFETKGAEHCGSLTHTGDAAWTQQSALPPVYYTQPLAATFFTWPGTSDFTFNITVGADTPADYYDLKLATAGKDTAGKFYSEAHFYLQVVAATPSIALDKTALTASVVQGASPADDSFTVGNAGQGTLNYTIASDAAWVSVSPTSGASTGPANAHAVHYSTASLAPGTYQATLTVTDASASNSPQTIGVTLTVVDPGNGGTPSIALDTSSLAPAAVQGGSPADETFTVNNGAQGALNYTIASSAAWLTISPASGSTTGAANTHTVHYNVGSLAAGSYPATITVSDPAATNNPQTVTVVLTVTAPTTGGGDSGNTGTGDGSTQTPGDANPGSGNTGNTATHDDNSGTKDDAGASAGQGDPSSDENAQAQTKPAVGMCGAGSAGLLPAALLGLACMRVDLLRRRRRP
jgi:hypothetical protein